MKKNSADRQGRIEKSNAIIESLADEFDCVCYVELTQNPEGKDVEIFRASDFLVTHVPELKHERNLHRRLNLICNNLVCESDRDFFYKSTRREAIIENLENSSPYAVPFRCLVDGMETYYQMSFFADRDEENRLKGFVMRLRNVDKDIRNKQRYELERHLNESIVMKFGEQVESVFVFNPTKSTFRTLYCKEELKGLFPMSGKLDVNRGFVAMNIIHPADRKIILEGLNIDNILDRLSREHNFRYLFRDIALGYARWFEVRVMRFDIGDENEFLVGFVNKNTEIIDKKINEKIRDEFASIYLINLEEDTIQAVRKSPFYKGDEYKTVVKFTTAFNDALDAVHEDFSEQWKKLGNIDYLKELLADEDHREFIYKHRDAQNPYFWCRSVFSVLDRADGVPTTLVMTSTSVDKDQSEKLSLSEELSLQKKELERNLSIIEALSAEYTSVYYINLDTEEITPYSMNKATANAFGETFKRNVKYSSAYSVYVEKFVSDIYRERMLQAGSIKNIREQLVNRKSFNTMYVNFLNRYCEMKFVKVGDSSNPKFVALGFADKEDLLRKELQQQAVIQGLAEDFDLVCYIDTVSMHENVYRCTDVFPRIIPDWPDIHEFHHRLSIIKEKFVFKDDRNYFYEQTRREVILDNLKSKNAYYVNFRAKLFGRIEYWQIKFLLTATNPVQIVAGFRCVDEEMRKQKQDKEALEQALQMANSASRAKTTFLNNMSHDIRTPMNAIIGFTGLAANHINNKEQVADYLGKIKQSSEHLLSLINDVLDMSRIESGKMNICERPEKLSDIIHMLKGLVLSDVRSRQQNFIIELENVRNELILCDKLRLNQVLLNVVSNAIKYTPQKGSVLFNIKEVPAETGYAVFEFLVKDNGIGMSEDFLLQIFDPFTRVNSSTVSGIQGTGLGMSITKNIVDMMGGTIDIKSEENVGTEVLMTFKFKLHEETDLFAGIEKFNGMRCLIVDDVLSVCESVSDIFKKHGLCPDWCLSGEAALEYLERSVISENPYRLFVIDWNMPEMNGIQLSRKIRKIVGPHVPIIVLTSYDWIDIEKEALEAGVTAFYAKPLFPSDLRHLLLKFCDESLEKFTNLNSLEIKQKKFDFTGRKVMLVEDNELNREISTEILEDRGIEVTAMESGDLAVEKLKYSSAPFDLILMDIQMPGIDGYEATRQIRAMKNKEIANIPIIAMTANAFDEDKRMAMEAGMNDHVAKPVDVDVLCATLAKYFR